MSLVIEQFTSKYQESVKNFIIESWKEFSFTYIPEEDSDLDNIQKYYIDNHGMFYILREGSTILGTIGLTVNSDNSLELSRLYVDKSKRGNGFGSSLVDQAIVFATQNKFTKIKLDSNKIFQKAHSLYQKKGFKIIKEDQQDFYMEKIVEN